MTKLDYYSFDYSNRGGKPYVITSGTVVYRINSGRAEYLLLIRHKDGNKTWHLPKGTLNIDEALEACAIRETKEEAGINVSLKTYLGASNNQYTYKGVYYDKSVHFYGAEYINDIGDMDDEHDFKDWYSFTDAINCLKTNVKREDVFVQRCMDYISEKVIAK